VLTKAQSPINLVPNPSFEQDTACPNNIDQMYKLKNWFAINDSPDYYNKCYYGPLDYAAIPKNTAGYQNVSGLCHSYAGIATCTYPSYPTNNSNNENFAVKLIDSLIIGKRYFFSMRVSFANNYKTAANNLGARFSTKSPATTLSTTPTNFAQVTFSQVVTDTLNWVLLAKSYTADSVYKYISIGNFYDTLSTTKITVNPSGFPGSYYYIDDICLSDDSTYTYSYAYNCTLSSVHENFLNKKIEIYPNPCNDYFYVIGINDKTKFEWVTVEGKIIKYGYAKEFEKTYINDLPESVYVLQLYNDKDVLRKKIVVKH
jgi:hypothetical protein